MSVTKSVLSALIGIAIDRHLIPNLESPISSLLPKALFAGESDIARFQSITLKQVMGMAALDAPDPPRQRDPESLARYREFWSAPNRAAVALRRPLLAAGSFQYNDSTPSLAAAALQHATGESALDFAAEALFTPLSFRNYEWMHQDPSGLDNGGYGLRLRPVDMQKLGLLYLRGGVWNGRRLISQQWIERSFEPWNRSTPELAKPDYGWFWWTRDYGPGWTAHEAHGWKGQRIAVFPEQDMVVTMTACIEDGTENELFGQLVTRVLAPSVARGGEHSPGDPGALAALLAEVRRGSPRFGDFIEHRMVPAVAPKSVHRRFVVH
jgi:CubicO group peptidase (beta-lactamase class C family)